jgi:hypothetical protein
MTFKTFASGAFVLKLAVLAALPIGMARADDGHGAMRVFKEGSAQIVQAAGLFARQSAAAPAFSAKAAGGDPRHGRGQAGKHRRK